MACETISKSALMSVKLVRRLTSYIFPTCNIYTRLKKISVVRGLGMTTLETLNFDNRVLKSLPLDREEKNYVRTVQGVCVCSKKLNLEA